MSVAQLTRICDGFTVLLLAVVVSTFASGCVSSEPVGPPQSVELKFMPREPSRDTAAAWTALVPFIDDDIVATAHLGMGDWFRVAEPDGPELFRVHLVSGDDSGVVIEARAGATTRRMKLKKDGQAYCKIAGVEYEFTYPRSWVAVSSLPETGTSGYNELTPEGHVSKIMLMVRRIAGEEK
jgi:hypothetical protein